MWMTYVASCPFDADATAVPGPDADADGAGAGAAAGAEDVVDMTMDDDGGALALCAPDEQLTSAKSADATKAAVTPRAGLMPAPRKQPRCRGSYACRD